MKSTFKKLTLGAIALSSAVVSFAQLNAPIIPPSAGGQTGSNIGSNLNNIVLAFKNISTGVYSSLFIVALIAFGFGIIKAMFSSKPEGKANGLKSIGFGVVAMFAMVGIWGLVSFLSANLGVGVGGDIPTPGVPSSVRTF
jgi:hypothetical protein